MLTSEINLLLTSDDCLQEKHVDTVHLREIHLAVLRKPIIELFLSLELLHNLMHIDFLDFWQLLHLAHGSSLRMLGSKIFFYYITSLLQHLLESLVLIQAS
jgi:hypothetical protein